MFYYLAAKFLRFRPKRVGSPESEADMSWNLSFNLTPPHPSPESNFSILESLNKRGLNKSTIALLPGRSVMGKMTVWTVRSFQVFIDICLTPCILPSEFNLFKAHPIFEFLTYWINSPGLQVGVPTGAFISPQNTLQDFWDMSLWGKMCVCVLLRHFWTCP